MTSSDQYDSRPSQLTRAQIEVWLSERWENCLLIAATKTGDDKAGWLEDAVYFSEAIGLIRRLSSDLEQTK